MANENDNISINIGSDPSGVERGSRRATTSIKGVNKEAKELDTAFRRLKSAVDPTFAATEKYNKSLADNKRLLAAGKIDRQEYLANTKALRTALDSQVASIQRNTQAGRAAAAEAKRQSDAAKMDARTRAQEEAIASRQAAQAKILAARTAAAAVEAAHKKEQVAITLSARMARQAAVEARALATRATAPSVTRGVSPGSIDTAGRSIKQLEYQATRSAAAAEKAATRAMEAAARAAESTSARVAKAAEDAANRSKTAAEEAANRAISLARAKASAEGAEAQRSAQMEKQARQQATAAAREASTAAAQAAGVRKRAEREAAAAARDAAEAIRRQAVAEREASNAAQQLRASIDPVFASQQRYNDVMRQATQLLMQNKLATGEWTRIQQQAKAQMDVNVRSMGRMNSVYVQMGYQAQDVTASLASGINPLVILAQQGGQTAAALSQMGGTIGKVASFMAGPWGAAIIGITLLIGLMTQTSKEQKKADEEAKKATLDLKNAEEVRKAPLDKLTDSLKEYVKTQKEANLTRREALELEGIAASLGAIDSSAAVNKAMDDIAAAEKDLRELRAQGPQGGKGGLELYAGKMAVLDSKLRKANEDYRVAVDALAVAQQAQSASSVDQIKRQVTLQLDASEEIQDTYDNEVSAATKRYEASKRSAADELAFKDALIAASKKQEKAEKDLSDAKKKSSDATKKAQTGNPIEDINRAAAYAESQGFRVGKIGKNGVSTGAGHAEGRAVDINAVGGDDSADPAAKARLDKLALEYQKMGYTVLWGGKRYDAGSNAITLIAKPKNAKGDWQHTRHMHLEAPKGGAYVKGSADAANQALEDSIAKEKALRQEALDTLIEDLSYKQQIAEDDFAQQLKLQDEKITALTAHYGAESREVIRGQRERLQIERRGQQALLREQQEGIQRQLDAGEMAADQISKLAEIDLGQSGDNSDFNQQNGLISEREAIIAKAVLLDQEYAAQQAHEARMYALRLTAVKEQLALANIAPAERSRLLNQLAQMEVEHNNRIAINYRQHSRDVNGLVNQMASLQAQQWRDIASTITSSLGSALQGLWTKSMSFKDAMVQIADQLVYKFFDMGLKILENWVVQQFTKKAVTTATTAAETGAVLAGQTAQTAAVIGGTLAQVGAKATAGATETGIVAATTGAAVAGEIIKTAAAVTSAATSTGVNAAAGMTNITISAAESAAGAFKSTVIIPFIGPVAAPVAAGLALATVLGFGALISASGGQARVPYDGQITELHKDEMVLPAWLANPLRNNLGGMGPQNAAGNVGMATLAGMSSSSNSQSSANFYYQPSYSPSADNRLGDMLRKDGRDMRKWVKNQVRNNRLNLGDS